MIKIDEGKYIDAPTLAHYAIKEWEKFIDKYKLDDHNGIYMKQYLKKNQKQMKKH